MDNKKHYNSILSSANELMNDAEAQQKTEYLINKRIFNNAFAALLREGVPAVLSDDGSQITITAAGTSYLAKSATISQILREDYEVALNICLARSPKEDENRLSDFDDVFGSRLTEIELSNFDFSLPSIGDVPIDELVDDKEDTMSKVANSVRETSAASPLDSANSVRKITRESEPIRITREETKEKAGLVFDIEDEDEEDNGEFNLFEISEFVKNDKPEGNIEDDEENPVQNTEGKIFNLFDYTGKPADPEGDDSKATFDAESMPPAEKPSRRRFRVIHTSDLPKEEYHSKADRHPARRSSFSENEYGGSPDIDISESLFKPKNDAASRSVIKEVKILPEEKPKKGLFSFFRKKKETAANSVRETKPAFEPKGSSAEYSFIPNNAIKNTAVHAGPVKEEIDSSPRIVAEEKKFEDHTHDGGELFQHIKNVILKKKLGTDLIGPYRFIFWPTSLPKTPERVFAEMIVYVIDASSQTDYTYLCDSKSPELRIQLESKEFKVYGIWEDGEFTSHVDLVGKTASIFDIETQTEATSPDIINEEYLEQFRMEKKGQPKHMILPFKNSNRGEKNIPIIGFIEYNGKKVVLKRHDGNTLKYKFNGRVVEVTGHYERGKFVFSADAESLRFG